MGKVLDALVEFALQVGGAVATVWVALWMLENVAAGAR